MMPNLQTFCYQSATLYQKRPQADNASPDCDVKDCDEDSDTDKEKIFLQMQTQPLITHDGGTE